jgi:predicted GIY-YIG superfamily endonuclease
MSAHEGGPHILYRMFDADGDLLYIGMTNDIEFRLYMHANTKYWWRDVASISLNQDSASRRELEDAERAAIKAECPRYNVMHNDERFRRRPPTKPSPETRAAMERAFAPLTEALTDPKEPA